MGVPDSNPWVSSSGEIASPASPRGGGGAGGFAIPKPLGTEGNRSDTLPHPWSYGGRVLLANNLERTLKKAQGEAKAPSAARFVVTLKEFHNTGKAQYLKEVEGNMMGVHPPHNFFVNAVEIAFQVDIKLANARGIKEYRCRQKIYEQELWEQELKDGNLTPWKKTMSVGEGPDDPDPLLQTTSPPTIAYFDAPGFMAAASDEQLQGPGGKKTSKMAVAVFMRQNFVGWIEGRGSKKDNEWKPVSDGVKWHSNQSLVKDIFSHPQMGLGGRKRNRTGAQPVFRVKELRNE